MMSRKNLSPTAAAKLILKFLKVQYENIQNNPDAVVFSYELLTENPREVVKLISNKIPSLADIDIEREFKAHNFLNKKLTIQNLNVEKINKIDPKDIQSISQIFSEEKELLRYFGYDIL